MKIRMVLDTNAFMKKGVRWIFRIIYSLIKNETHMFVLLTCVEKELNKLALVGNDDAVAGLRRLEKLKSLATYERIDVLQVYADDPIVGYCSEVEELTCLISGDRGLNFRVLALENPNMQLFNLTANGMVLPFDPTYEPEIELNVVEVKKEKADKSEKEIFLEDLDCKQMEYFIIDLYKNSVDLPNMEGQILKYTLENIIEELHMIDSLCRNRALTDAESKLIDLATKALDGN